MAGLRAKRDDLANDLKGTRKHERWLLEAIENVEKTLDLYREGGTIRRHYSKAPVTYAESGSVLRHVTGMLRKADGPITAAQIVEAWIKKEGLIASHGTFVILRKRIGARLNKLKVEGVIRRVKLDGPYDGWEFIP